MGEWRMDVLAKKTIKRTAVTLFIIISCLMVYGYGILLNAVSATMAKRRSDGQALWRDFSVALSIGDTGQTENMSLHCFANSTDLINMLHKRHGRSAIAADSNIWTIVKDLPTNAPDNFVVMCTRNIDPNSLRLRLSGDEMEGEIRFSDPKDKLLKNYGILIRKNGSGYIGVHTGKPVSPGLSYRHVYQNKEFGLLPGKGNSFSVKYLTPTGEVNVEE